MARRRPRKKTDGWGPWSLKRLSIALCALAAAGAGCELFVNAVHGKRELSPFPHQLHIVKEEMQCSDCHEPSEDGGPPLLPGKDLCSLCHEDEKFLARFFTDDTPHWSRSVALSPEIVFDHSAHAGSDDKKCLLCHKNVAESSAIWTDMGLTMAGCEQCHAKNSMGHQDCSVCHREVRRDTPPSSHKGSWETLHGMRSRGEGAESVTMDRCSLCHAPASCEECHLTRKPTSHTNYWRTRGHGIAAGVDRTKCETCHKRDSCDRCHREITPLSHRSGSFGSPLNRHCVGCHLPLSYDDSCAACHQSLPGHDQAPRLPNTVTHAQATAADCRVCHVPLPHPDNGQTCRFCHR